MAPKRKTYGYTLRPQPVVPVQEVHPVAPLPHPAPLVHPVPQPASRVPEAHPVPHAVSPAPFVHHVPHAVVPVPLAHAVTPAPFVHHSVSPSPFFHQAPLVQRVLPEAPVPVAHPVEEVVHQETVQVGEIVHEVHQPITPGSVRFPAHPVLNSAPVAVPVQPLFNGAPMFEQPIQPILPPFPQAPVQPVLTEVPEPIPDPVAAPLPLAAEELPFEESFPADFPAVESVPAFESERLPARLPVLQAVPAVQQSIDDQPPFDPRFAPGPPGPPPGSPLFGQGPPPPSFFGIQELPQSGPEDQELLLEDPSAPLPSNPPFVSRPTFQLPAFPAVPL